MSTASQQLALKYSCAWAARDPDAIVSMHTDDSVFHLHNVVGPACGRAAIRESVAGLFEQSPDLRFTPKRVFFGTDHFVSEYVMSGTVDGKSFACDGVDVFAP